MMAHEAPIASSRCARRAASAASARGSCRSGPWLDGWGETLGRALPEDECAEVVAALLENDERGPEEEGCLRALAGIDRARNGGLRALAHELPARVRKTIAQAPCRRRSDLDARTSRSARAHGRAMHAKDLA